MQLWSFLKSYTVRVSNSGVFFPNVNHVYSFFYHRSVLDVIPYRQTSVKQAQDTTLCVVACAFTIIGSLIVGGNWYYLTSSVVKGPVNGLFKLHRQCGPSKVRNVCKNVHNLALTILFHVLTKWNVSIG